MIVSGNFLIGAENVQSAQKYITGLDARRISKLPEQRYGSIALLILLHAHGESCYFGIALLCQILVFQEWICLVFQEWICLVFCPLYLFSEGMKMPN